MFLREMECWLRSEGEKCGGGGKGVKMKVSWGFFHNRVKEREISGEER